MGSVPFAAIVACLERWRSSLAPPFTLAYVDGFIRRHRAQVETLIADTLAHRRARGGERPAYKPDFLAYDALTTAQRLLDAQTDKEMWMTQASVPIKGPRSDFATENDYRDELVEEMFTADFLGCWLVRPARRVDWGR